MALHRDPLETLLFALALGWSVVSAVLLVLAATCVSGLGAVRISSEALSGGSKSSRRGFVNGNGELAFCAASRQLPDRLRGMLERIARRAGAERLHELALPGDEVVSVRPARDGRVPDEAAIAAARAWAASCTRPSAASASRPVIFFARRSTRNMCESVPPDTMRRPRPAWCARCSTSNWTS